MSTPTMSVLIHEWDDEPEDGRTADDWPYPTHHSKYLITGNLADKVRARLGEDESSSVTITEDRVSGGYSEYTQEDELFFEVECGSHKVEFDEHSPYVGYGATTVARLAAWLEEA